MKRREFITLVTASVAAAALPLSLLAKPSIDPAKIDWVMDHFDRGNTTAVAIQYDHRGPQWRRHAVRSYTPLADITPEEITNMKSILMQWLVESFQ